MKILTKGKFVRGYEGVWQCQECGCKWEMETEDTAATPFADQRDGAGYKMECPTCKRDVYRQTTRSCSGDWTRSARSLTERTVRNE